MYMANEKRLIDANALKVRLGDLEASGGHKYYRQGMDDVLHKFMPQILDDAPTVDAVEVPKEDYYVLRNTETGLYFRGKGANRWGKHFNQATIYRVKGTAEHSIKEVAWHGEKAELVRIKIIELGERKDNG
jgi:hypothetical protein